MEIDFLTACEISCFEGLSAIVVLSLIDSCYNKNSPREQVCGFYIRMRILPIKFITPVFEWLHFARGSVLEMQ